SYRSAIVIGRSTIRVVLISRSITKEYPARRHNVLPKTGSYACEVVSSVILQPQRDRSRFCLMTNGDVGFALPVGKYFIVWRTSSESRLSNSHSSQFNIPPAGNCHSRGTTVARY